MSVNAKKRNYPKKGMKEIIKSKLSILCKKIEKITSGNQLKQAGTILQYR